MPHRRCCAIMLSAEVALVSRKVPMGGGTCRAISAMVSSVMTPGPLGIAETSPKADAPLAIAARASSSEAMQQILTLGLVVTGDVRSRHNDPAAHGSALRSLQRTDWTTLEVD